MKSLWLSLLLLLITSIGVGWLTAHWNTHYQLWLLVGFLLLVNSAIVTYPAKTIDFSFVGLLRTDVRAFIITLLGCVTVVFLLTWLELFVDTLLVVSAGLLASLELHNARIKGLQTMLIIILIQLIGFPIGLFIHENWNTLVEHIYLLLKR